MQRVPVVVAGPLAGAFAARLALVRDDLAGREGLLLDVAGDLGPQPSVLVDTGGSFDAVVGAVLAGHAAATASLADLAARHVDLAVLRSDRRLGVGGALLPGLPVASVLARHLDAGDAVTPVVIDGPAAPIDEAVVVAGLLGVELSRAHVRVDGDPALGGQWRAVVGDRFPTVSRADGPPPDHYTVRVGATTLRGPAGGAERVVSALLADVLALVREADRPWRAHRRLTSRVS